MTTDKCILYGSCKCQTAGCVDLPDKGCPVYRYFKDLILEDHENRLKKYTKDEVIAMFAHIYFELEEAWISTNLPSNRDQKYGLTDAMDIIREYINALRKGDKE